MQFGGLLRDVLCGRSLAIGSQSYAFATGLGATVYVCLRELCVRGLPLPLGDWFPGLPLLVPRLRGRSAEMDEPRDDDAAASKKPRPGRFCHRMMRRVHRPCTYARS